MILEKQQQQRKNAPSTWSHVEIKRTSHFFLLFALSSDFYIIKFLWLRWFHMLCVTFSSFTRNCHPFLWDKKAFVFFVGFQWISNGMVCTTKKMVHFFSLFSHSKYCFYVINYEKKKCYLISYMWKMLVFI